jgi:outer membrane protein assembly factor BamB
MLRRTALIALVLAIAPGCSTVKGWFHSDKTKSIEPTPLTAIASPIGVKKLWSTGVGDGEGELWLRQHPTLDGNRVYVVDDSGDVLALDAGTGKKLWSTQAVILKGKRGKWTFWKREALEAGLTSSPGVGNGMVVVGGRNGEVVALAAETGEKRWAVKVTSEVLSAPLVLPDKVVVRSNDGRVFGLDATDGSRKWVFDRGLPTLSLRGNSSPIGGANGLVYVGYDDGSVVAIRLDDGQKVWEQTVAEPEGRSEIDRMADIDGDMQLGTDELYAVSMHNQVMAISAGNGQPLWNHEIGSANGLTMTADKILLSDSQGNVWALDRATGNSLWKQDMLARRVLTTPVVQGDYAVVGDLEGYLHWLRLDNGQIVGRAKVEKAALRGAPQVSPDGVLYALSNEGELAAYKLGN